MERGPYSIFNDVIGPVTIGPSSSHTAGPARIGKLAGQLLKQKVRCIHIEFERKGSFAASYHLQGTDRGFVGGIMGLAPEDPRMLSVLHDARAAGVEIVFSISDFDAPHPNTARITLTGSKGEKAYCVGISMGGGIIAIIDINHTPVEITGEHYELLVFLSESEAEKVDALVAQLENFPATESHCIAKSFETGCILAAFQSRHEIPQEQVDELVKQVPHAQIRQLDPVFPVLSIGDCTVPYKTAAQLLQWAEDRNLEPWEAGLYYEVARSGLTPQAVLEKMEGIVSIMETCVEQGLRGEKPGQLIKPTAGKYLERARRNELIPVGAMHTVISWAMAAVEVNSYYGVVVAAPTGGACGVLPGAVLGTAHATDRSRTDKAKALLTAGAIGLLIAQQATFSAELCGCQAECGAGSAMAAAGLIQLAGGSVRQSVEAASIALQNVLGMICDSVADLVEVPCLGKNVMASTNAVACANMVLAGSEAIIPLDEVIVSMYKVGELMPPELCCTGLAGLAITKSSRELKANLEKRRKAGVDGV